MSRGKSAVAEREAPNVSLKIVALRKYLDAVGWTESELARRMEISPKQLSHVTTGLRRPGQRFIARLLRTTGARFDQFFEVPAA